MADFIAKTGVFCNLAVRYQRLHSARDKITLAANVTVRRGPRFLSLSSPGERSMTSRFRAMLGSSLMLAAIAIAPMAASAQTPATVTQPKAAKTTTKATKRASKKAEKAAATAAKADEKTEPKTVKAAEKKVVAAKKAETKAAAAETKAAAKGDTKAANADAKKVATAKKAETKAVKAETKAVVAANMVGCADGTMSKAGRGACSGHGGVKTNEPAKAVANKIAAAPAASSRAVTKAAPRSAVAAADDANSIAAGALARCKDGTYSHAKNRTGACSRHGGVAAWM